MIQPLNRYERQCLRAKIRSNIEQSGSTVLCTLIGKTGAFYRPIGFQCAIDGNGNVSPFFAGSCTDRLVAEMARDHAQRGAFPAIVRLDSGSAEDAVFGSGSGCGGAVEILCEQLTAEDLPKIDLLIGPDLIVANTRIELTITQLGHKVSVSRRGSEMPGVFRDANARHFVLHRLADPRLWIIGGADDAFALCRQAGQLGWWVGVVDHRPVEHSQIKADQVIRSRPSPHAHFLGPNDHVVVMSHNLDIDRQWLEAMATAPFASVALLGPTDRCQRILSHLDPGQKNAIMPKLRARPGTNYRSRSPELLSVSIMAELQTIWENDAMSEAAGGG